MQTFGGIVFGLSAAFAVAAAPPTPDKPPVTDNQKAADALLGAYTIVSGERSGKAIPEADVKGAIVSFMNGQIVGTDKDRKDFFAANFTVDATKKPWKIDMRTVAATKPEANERPRERTTSGLVKKEGDTLTIIYALPGGDAPMEFKTKENQQMFVLKTYEPEKLPNKFPSALPGEK